MHLHDNEIRKEKKLRKKSHSFLSNWSTMKNKNENSHNHKYEKKMTKNQVLRIFKQITIHMIGLSGNVNIE